MFPPRPVMTLQPARSHYYTTPRHAIQHHLSQNPTCAPAPHPFPILTPSLASTQSMPRCCSCAEAVARTTATVSMRLSRHRMMMLGTRPRLCWSSRVSPCSSCSKPLEAGRLQACCRTPEEGMGGWGWEGGRMGGSGETGTSDRAKGITTCVLPLSE